MTTKATAPAQAPPQNAEPPEAGHARQPLSVRFRRGMLSASRWVVSFGVLILIWSLAVRFSDQPDFLLPSPGQVWDSAVESTRSGTLLDHVYISVLRVFTGSAVAFVVAIPLAVAMGTSQKLSEYIWPVVVFFQAIPGIAWVPLAILWLGIGYKTVTFVVFLSVFFPILFNALVGIRGVNQNLANAALTLGASRFEVIRHVLIPGSVANIVTGVRLGMAYGWRALVAVEIIGGTSGVGYMIFDARAQLASDVVVVGMFTLGILWLLIDSLLLRPVERRTVERWGN
jgi:taurine transport system permease protein